MENNKATFSFTDVEWDGIFYDGEDLERILSDVDEDDVDTRVIWEIFGERGLRFFIGDWPEPVTITLTGPDAFEAFLGWLFDHGYDVEPLIDAF